VTPRPTSPRTSATLNEAKTRVLHIDPQLRAADWKLNDRAQVRLEVPVDGYDAEPWNGVKGAKNRSSSCRTPILM
jgi:type I site-specific restriction endonuclease